MSLFRRKPETKGCIFRYEDRWIFVTAHAILDEEIVKVRNMIRSAQDEPGIMVIPAGWEFEDMKTPLFHNRAEPIHIAFLR